MTILEELLKDVEKMEKEGKSKEEIVRFIDEAVRLANSVTLAVL